MPDIMKLVGDGIKWLVQQYGLVGAVLAASIYVNRILWKDNKDLRARNDRWTDRYMAMSGFLPDNKDAKQ